MSQRQQAGIPILSQQIYFQQEHLSAISLPAQGAPNIDTRCKISRLWNQMMGDSRVEPITVKVAISQWRSYHCRRGANPLSTMLLEQGTVMRQLTVHRSELLCNFILPRQCTTRQHSPVKGSIMLRDYASCSKRSVKEGSTVWPPTSQWKEAAVAYTALPFSTNTIWASSWFPSSSKGLCLLSNCLRN